MSQFKKISCGILSVLCLGAISLQAESSGCARCDQIREDNALHHKNYEYYDDYEKTENRKCKDGNCTPPAPISPPGSPESDQKATNAKATSASNATLSRKSVADNAKAPTAVKSSDTDKAKDAQPANNDSSN